MVLSFASVCSAATEVKNDGSWKITATSDNGNTVGRAVDGDSTTYWHTKFTVIDGKITSHDECPHTITIDFGKEMTLSGWHYKPRQDSGTPSGSGTASEVPSDSASQSSAESVDVSGVNIMSLFNCSSGNAAAAAVAVFICAVGVAATVVIRKK